MVNRETRRALMPPDAISHQLKRRRPPGELSGTQYSHRKPWARSAQPPGQTNPHPEKKEKENKLNNNNKKRYVAKRVGRRRRGRGQSLTEL
jgi:hypothetical protein